ncbi:MAG: CHAT domain-containing protein [Acidobacteriia bacterium]|nr:CHAT domain-containing protein [Terriglobia bacterium]
MGVRSTTQHESASSTDPATQMAARALQVGKRIESRLSNDECDSFQFTLSAGEFAHVRVHSRAMNIGVRLSELTNGVLYAAGSFDSYEPEYPIAVIAREPRTYRLEVCARRNKSAGDYWIEMDELRGATTRDADSSEAEKLLDEAFVLDRRNDAELFPKIIQKFEESLARWRAIGDRFKEAMVLHHFGNVYHSQGEYQRALDYFSQALPIFRSVGGQYMEAVMLTSIGEEYWFLSEYRQSLIYLDQGLDLYRQLKNSMGGQGWALNDIASVYSAIGEKEKALDFAFQSLRTYESSDYPGDLVRGRAIANTAIGRIYASVGEKQKALDYFELALPYWRAAKDLMGEARALHQIGEVYASLGENHRALDYYNQSFSLNHQVGYRYGEALALHSLGTLLISSNELLAAAENLQKALQLRREMGERRGEASTLTSLGLVYQRLKDDRKELEYYDEALSLWRQVGDRPGEASTLTYIGELYYARDDQKRALEYLNQALPIRKAVSDVDGEAVSLYDLARIDRDRGEIIAACEKMKRVIEIAESIRGNLGIQEVRATYLASVHDYYEFYVDLLMKLDERKPLGGYSSKALQINERARARSLLDTLAQARAKIRRGMDPLWVEQERSLRRRLNAKTEYYRQLTLSKVSHEETKGLEKEIEGLSKEYQIVQHRIRSSNPNYAALTQSQPLRLTEIQQGLIDTDTVLLEYALGEEHSYLWVVSPTSLASFGLPKRAEIEAASRRVYDLLVARNSRDKDESIEHRGRRLKQAEDEYPVAAAVLGRMVLGPASHLLGNKRLLIVADGALQYIPFAALPDPATLHSQFDDPSDGRHGGWTPLVSNHEIVNLPSASTLEVLRREMTSRKPAGKLVAVLADPVFEKDDPRVKGARRSQAGSTLGKSNASNSAIENEVERSAVESGVTQGGAHIPRLPFARREAEAILDRVPKDQRKADLDFEANLAAAKGPELSRYRIVHFATHGLLNSVHPELSGLVLSLVNRQGQPQDGFLRLNEIYNLDLPADLVVLSACQTGLGKEIKGEGLIGLTRGFMYAGAARVMASLWKVDDRATGELMARFYDAMLGEQHLTPAAALRKAQMSLWKEKQWASPYYWAAFTLQGEWK